ncbi:MAG: hypothetical protein AMJ90_00455 [candidate division Zixibacteria bacterium SM23_73_2]|nr:MAG: hypothetical protein AMJ90_00455 [candidate division Zixibacteria bacterium SM23_73_2]
MRILGIDTATMLASIGIIEDEKVLVEMKFDVKITYSEVLLYFVDYLLRSSNLKTTDLDGFSVSIGPGSFTGLRIGLSTVKGLSFSTGKPVVAVPTLDALASHALFSFYPVVPLIDAKKNQVYSAVYDTKNGQIKRKSPYFAISLEDLVRKLSGRVLFSGPGVFVFRKRLEKLMKKKKAYYLLGETALPSGVAVAKLGFEKLKKGKIEDLSSLVPLYVRESEAELKFKND